MVDVKPILRAGVAAQAAALASDNLAFAKRKKKNFMKQGMRNIVGASMIQTQSQIIGGL